MIIELPKGTLFMFLFAVSMPVVAAEAMMASNDSAEIVQHVNSKEALAWGIRIVPGAAEVDGSSMSLYARDAFLHSYASSADISVPNLLTWASESGERPAVEFSVRPDLGAPYVDHNPLTGRWSVSLPGVLRERVGVSSEEVAAQASAKISYSDGRFHLDRLRFQID